MLPLNATVAVTANYDRTLKQQKLLREQYDLLKKNFISTINPHDLVVLRHPQYALLHVTARAIFAHITELHGTLDNADYIQLLGISNTPTLFPVLSLHIDRSSNSYRLHSSLSMPISSAFTSKQLKCTILKW